MRVSVAGAGGRPAGGVCTDVPAAAPAPFPTRSSCSQRHDVRGLGVVPVARSKEAGSPVGVLLERYRLYLTVQRDLTAGIARDYVDAVRPFLAGGAGQRARFRASHGG